MMGRGVFQVFCVATLLLGSAGARALDANGLRQLVQQYMQGQTDNLLARYGKQSRLQIGVINVDQRLFVPDCPQPPALSSAEQTGNQSRLNVQVSCAGGVNWSVYVPVEIAVFRPVVTLANPLPRNAAISAADVQLTELDITRIGGPYLTRPEDAIGMSLKRQLNAGVAITSDQLLPPLLIRRGDAVTITAESDGLTVHMPGVALTDGRRGEQIRIKNSNSAKVVDAQVIEAGMVAVAM